MLALAAFLFGYTIENAAARPEPERARPSLSPAGGADRGKGRRRSLSLGRKLPEHRLRLFRARLLGLRAPRDRAPSQLVRAVRQRAAGARDEAEGRGHALLLRARPRRSVLGPRPDGPRASVRAAGRGRETRTLGVRKPAGWRTAHRFAAESRRQSRRQVSQRCGHCRPDPRSSIRFESANSRQSRFDSGSTSTSVSDTEVTPYGSLLPRTLTRYERWTAFSPRMKAGSTSTIRREVQPAAALSKTRSHRR
jgi:hypothetical protein